MAISSDRSGRCSSVLASDESSISNPVTLRGKEYVGSMAASRRLSKRLLQVLLSADR